MRVVVTRAAHQAEEVAQLLRAAGAEPLLLPTIAIVPPEDIGPLRSAMARLLDYQWLIFTSINAIDAFLRERPVDVEPRAKIATIGSATRDYAEQRGLRVTVTPEKYSSEGLMDALGALQLESCRILIPSAAVTRDVVPGELRKRGAIVDVVEAYRNIIPPGAEAHAREIFRDPFPDWVTFASPSAVENLVQLVGADPLRHLKIASIGPATSKAIAEHGLHVSAEASPHTIPGLIAAVLNHYRDARSGGA